MFTDVQYKEEKRLWIVEAMITIFWSDGAKTSYQGHAFERESDSPSDVNYKSALENCETSAWGRALAAAGILIDKGIASSEEMSKVEQDNYMSESNFEKALNLYTGGDKEIFTRAAKAGLKLTTIQESILAKNRIK